MEKIFKYLNTLVLIAILLFSIKNYNDIQAIEKSVIKINYGTSAMLTSMKLVDNNIELTNRNLEMLNKSTDVLLLGQMKIYDNIDDIHTVIIK